MEEENITGGYQMAKCSTCKIIKEYRQEFAEAEKTLNKTRVIKAKLLLQTYGDDSEHCSELSFRTVDLQFCPECGKKINRDQTKWEI